MVNKKLVQLTKKLEQDLLQLYHSPLLTGESLQKAMGYKSIHALRQAIARKLVPIDVFKIENRRGYYALTADVAHWLAANVLNNSKSEEKEVKKE